MEISKEAVDDLIRTVHVNACFNTSYACANYFKKYERMVFPPYPQIDTRRIIDCNELHCIEEYMFSDNYKGMA